MHQLPATWNVSPTQLPCILAQTGGATPSVLVMPSAVEELAELAELKEYGAGHVTSGVVHPHALSARGGGPLSASRSEPPSAASKRLSGPNGSLWSVASSVVLQHRLMSKPLRRLHW